MIYTIQLYPEICCDYCNEIAHNHFDCPVCKQENAPTDIYGNAVEDDEFECENCGSKFEFIKKEPPYHVCRYGQIEVKLLNQRYFHKLLNKWLDYPEHIQEENIKEVESNIVAQLNES